MDIGFLERKFFKVFSSTKYYLLLKDLFSHEETTFLDIKKAYAIV
jgi:hypothetical protein